MSPSGTLGYKLHTATVVIVTLAYYALFCAYRLQVTFLARLSHVTLEVTSYIFLPPTGGIVTCNITLAMLTSGWVQIIGVRQATPKINTLPGVVSRGFCETH